MKKNILLFVSLAILFFSLGFLTNHLLNRMLNTACTDIESFNKIQSEVEQADEEEMKVMHESFKKQKLQEGKSALPETI